MKNKPDYGEIFEYEQEIEVLVNHNSKKYNYVGEEGREYEVIASVFYEINKLLELSNKQILWYAIILNLVKSFYNQRVSGHLSDPLIVETPYGFKAGTKVKDSETKRNFPVPPYIIHLENYIYEIARMGVLAAAKKRVSPGYLDYKLERIASLLTGLLENMTIQAAGESEEELFILTIKNAAENVIKAGENFSTGKEIRLAPLDSRIYQKLITERINGIEKNRLAAYYNMADFWNGFISGCSSPPMMG